MEGERLILYCFMKDLRCLSAREGVQNIEGGIFFGGEGKGTFLGLPVNVFDMFPN